MSKTSARFFLAVSAALFLGAPLASQSETGVLTDEDIFAEGAFDQAVSEGKAASDAASLSWLGGVTLVAANRTVWFADSGNYADSGGFTGKAFLKATQSDSGSLFVSYAFSHTLIEATNDAGLRALLARQKPDLDTPDFSLSELHLSFDVNKVLFLRAGNQILSWGSSYFWSPADFVNDRPVDVQASFDARTGKSGIRAHLPLDNSNLFVFADLSGSIDALGVPQDITKKARFAFRADRTFWGFNTGVLGASGPGGPTRLGLATSGKLFGLDVWAETGSTLPSAKDGFAIASSAGGEKTFGLKDEWNVRGEFFHNSAGEDDAELSVPVAFEANRLGKYYGYLSSTRSKLLGSDSSLGLWGVMNFSDLSWTATATFGLVLPKLLPVNFSLGYNGGEKNREYTVQTGGPAWTFGIRSVLQF